MLAPWALLGLAFAAIPIILHLLRRQNEPRVVSFPALQYLTDKIREHERTVRLRELLLLALRLAAVLVAVLGAARWLLPFGSGGGTLPPADVVVVLDRGAPAAVVLDATRLLDVQTALAAAALRALGPQDQVWIVASHRIDGLLAAGVSPESALEALSAPPLEGEVAEVGPSDLPSAILRGDAILATRPAGRLRRILVVESGLKAASDPDPETAYPETRALLLRVAPAAWNTRIEQRGIAEVQVQRGSAPKAGVPIEVDVTLAGAEIEGVSVRGFVSDRPVAGGRTDANGRAVLVLPPLAAGVHTGWIEIDPDLLRADDRWPFTLHVRPPPQIQGVPAGAGARVIDALEVLAAGGRIVLSSLGASSAGGSTPESALMVAGSGMPRIPSPETEFGILVLPPTDGGSLPQLNRTLEAMGAPWRFGPPLSAGSRRVTASGHAVPPLDGVEVHRGWQIFSVRSGWGEPQVLATLDGGEPWILEAREGSRVIRIVGSPLDAAWTDLPTQVAMVPLLDRLLDPGGNVVERTTADGPLRSGAVHSGALRPAAVRPVPSPGVLEPVNEGGVGRASKALHRVEPDGAWTRRLLPERQRKEAGVFLPWLLLAILIAERRISNPSSSEST